MSRNDTLSVLVLPHASSSVGVGCHGSDMAEAPGSFREGSPGWGSSTISSSVLAGSSVVLGPDVSPWEISLRRDLLTQAQFIIPDRRYRN